MSLHIWAHWWCNVQCYVTKYVSCFECKDVYSKWWEVIWTQSVWLRSKVSDSLLQIIIMLQSSNDKLAHLYFRPTHSHTFDALLDIDFSACSIIFPEYRNKNEKQILFCPYNVAFKSTCGAFGPSQQRLSWYCLKGECVIRYFLEINHSFNLCLISLSISDPHTKAAEWFHSLKDTYCCTAASLKMTEWAFVLPNHGFVSATRMLNKIIKYWALKIVCVLPFCHLICPMGNCWMICR